MVCGVRNVNARYLKITIVATPRIADERRSLSD
jgi:hypothetical protein